MQANLAVLLRGILTAFSIAFLLSTSHARAAAFDIIAPDVISLKGKIELGDCERWKTALKPGIRYVMLSSIGGRAGQGECISRSIAALHLNTVVLNKCSSICFLLFAAGTEKAACAGSRIGVHRPSDAKTSEEDADPQYLNIILDYAKRYGVPDAIRQKLSETASHEIYYLTSADLDSMHAKDCR